MEQKPKDDEVLSPQHHQHTKIKEEEKKKDGEQWRERRKDKKVSIVWSQVFAALMCCVPGAARLSWFDRS